KKIAGVAGLLMCFHLGAAQAADAQGWQNGGWSLHYGADEGNHRVTVNRETAPLWEHRFSSSRIELVGELGLSYWWTNKSVAAGFSKHNWQLSAIPLFRWWATE